jgi:glycosyltransferase involved in cell wall biosynthesis
VVNAVGGRRIIMFQPGLRTSMGVRKHEDLGVALRALGHESELVSTAVAPADPAVPWRVLVEPAWTRGLVAELGAPFFRTRWLLGAALALAQYLRVAGKAIDVLYTLIAYPQATAAALAIALSGWRGRFVVMPAGEDVMVAKEAGFGFRRFPVPRRLVGWTLRRAHGICCISPAVREIVTGYRPRGIVMDVPDNVAAAVVGLAETSARELRERRERARRRVDEEFGTMGTPIALALGRLHPVKGLDRLVRLLPGHPHRLIVAGPSAEVRDRGDMASALRALASDCGVADRVAFTGRVPPERSYELLAAADVLAIPSYCETIPKTAVEAAALGTPFVVTDTCGVATALRGETLGRVVKHWDATAFAVALDAASALRPDPDECRALVQRYSPERVAGELDSLLEAIG